MGGSVGFGDDSSAYPTEGANKFVITNGVVKVVAADALNGLACVFSPGTQLVLPVDSADG
jgi:hypothetical protein